LLSIFINGKLTKAEWNTVSLTNEDEVSLIIPIAGG
jgi:sulfur carrier protein ThiS